MKFNKKSVVMQKEILKRRLGGELFVPIKLDDSAFIEGVCKAGNPISAEGKKVNDNTAIGILLSDTYDENPNGTIVRAFASVNEANANANAGITIATEAKTAMPLIVFE